MLSNTDQVTANQAVWLQLEGLKSFPLNYNNHKGNYLKIKHVGCGEGRGRCFVLFVFFNPPLSSFMFSPPDSDLSASVSHILNPKRTLPAAAAEAGETLQPAD